MRKANSILLHDISTELMVDEDGDEQGVFLGYQIEEYRVGRQLAAWLSRFLGKKDSPHLLEDQEFSLIKWYQRPTYQITALRADVRSPGMLELEIEFTEEDIERTERITYCGGFSVRWTNDNA